MSERSPQAQRCQVLALSGGGYRGLYSAEVLAQLETIKGSPIHTCFDLIAGTSIGGIIAIGLAMGQSAEVIRDSIVENGPSIFPGGEGLKGKVGRMARKAKSVVKPMYGTDGLRSALVAIVGEGKAVRDLVHPLLVPAVALTAGAPQLFRTAHHPDHQRYADIPLVEIALATAAAPIYFPAATVGDGEYVDGGLIANAPDVAAMLEAEHYLTPDRNALHVMSVGTTSAAAAFANRGNLEHGVASWARGLKLLEVTMAAQQEHALDLCEQTLGKRFFRIDAPQSKDQADVLALDSATPEAKRTLNGMATASVASAEKDPRLAQILAHRGRTVAERTARP